jgi:hypothetical protein
MVAADFDSLVGDWAAVGPAYYALARTLWSPATSNTSEIYAEYFDAFGPAASAMRAYMAYWKVWAQETYTNATILAQIEAFETAGSKQYIGHMRAQYVMAGELYSASVLADAATLLTAAEQACGVQGTVTCARVAKWRAHLDWTGSFAAAAAASTGHDVHAGSSDCTIPSTTRVAAAQALQAASAGIAGKSIVNVYYVLEKARERGDLLGLASAVDAPGQGSGLTTAFVLSTTYWFMALDPDNVGVREQWWEPTPRANWSRSSVGCAQGCSSPALQEWANTHSGTAYQGVSWWRVSGLCNPTCCAPLLGANTTRLYLRDGGGAASVQIWLNGVHIGGCDSALSCRQPLVLPLPTRASPSDATTTDVLVLAVNTTQPGQLRRLFTLY